MEKIDVGILGATGLVGQRLVQLLAHHPWFRLTTLAASPKSAGKKYRDACFWRLDSDMPESVRDMMVVPAAPDMACRVLFSGLSSAVALEIEDAFANNGHIVVSNARNHRMESDVPLLIPEVNPDHTQVIPMQKSRRQSAGGFIVTNPNCVAIPLAMIAAPIHRKWGVESMFVTTMQAISGAGYPGHAALDILDNVIPFIAGEEEKIESETRKILGAATASGISFADIRISAQVNRVAVSDGHLMTVALKLNQPATPGEVAGELEQFTALPQQLGLPTAPVRPIIVRREPNRPQPRLDRTRENGMAVVVGRIRPCPIFDIKCVVLGHNTIRGAAGAAVLNAELLKARGLLS
ncbi:MAG: aspartate-semialdehyde dehydrogenase [Candidatus Zhuqueibacterota bacterium]